MQFGEYGEFTSKQRQYHRKRIQNAVAAIDLLLEALAAVSDEDLEKPTYPKNFDEVVPDYPFDHVDWKTMYPGIVEVLNMYKTGLQGVDAEYAAIDKEAEEDAERRKMKDS
jgi:hypothetical protein